jgi:hypothetical protein
VYETQIGTTGEVNLNTDFNPAGESIYSSVASLSLPAGNYLLQVDVQIRNYNGALASFGGNRTVDCILGDIANPIGDEFFSSSVIGGGDQVISWHMASANSSPVTVTLACLVTTGQPGPSNVATRQGRFTATVISSVITQP